MNEDWVEATLGDLLTLEYGKALPEKSRDGRGAPVLGSNGVVGYHSVALVKGPGIVVGRKGTAGSVTWVQTDFSPIDTTYWVNLVNDGLSLEFAHHLLSAAGLPAICAQTGVPGLNRDRAYELDVLLPPAEVQRRIVDLMAHLDNHMANLRAERHVVEQLGAAMREEPLVGDVMVLGDVIRGIRGGKSPLTDGEQPSLTDDGVLKVSAVTPRRFVAEESKRLPAGHGLTKEIEVRPGDILITRANTPDRVGAVCRVPDSVRSGLYLCDKTLRLDVDLSRVDPDYLVEALNTRVARQHLTSAATGTSKSMFNISQDKIRSTPIVVPDRPSQTAYARRLNDQAVLLSSLDQELRTLSRARQSLIAALLSGVVRIPAEYDALLGEVA